MNKTVNPESIIKTTLEHIELHLGDNVFCGGELTVEFKKIKGANTTEISLFFYDGFPDIIQYVGCYFNEMIVVQDGKELFSTTPSSRVIIGMASELLEFTDNEEENKKIMSIEIKPFDKCGWYPLTKSIQEIMELSK